MFTIFVKQFNEMKYNNQCQRLVEKIKQELLNIFEGEINSSETHIDVSNWVEGRLRSILPDRNDIRTIVEPHPSYVNSVVVKPGNFYTAIAMAGFIPPDPTILEHYNEKKFNAGDYIVYFNSPDDYGVIPNTPVQMISVDIGFERGSYIEGVFISHRDIDEFMEPYVLDVKKIVDRSIKRLDIAQKRFSDKIFWMSWDMNTPEWRRRNYIAYYKEKDIV